MKKILAALLVACVATVVCAEAPKAEGKCPAARKEMRHPFKAYFDAAKTLKEKYPAEMAEIDALRKESFEKMKAANAKFAELAKKANIELPGAKRMEFKKKMDEFKKKYEKELKEIAELRKTDKKAAGAKFRELLKKEGIQFPKHPKGKFGHKGPRGPKDCPKDCPKDKAPEAK